MGIAELVENYQIKDLRGLYKINNALEQIGDVLHEKISNLYEKSKETVETLNRKTTDLYEGIADYLLMAGEKDGRGGKGRSGGGGRNRNPGSCGGDGTGHGRGGGRGGGQGRKG